MKRLTLTTIGTLAAVLAFSTGCSQSKKISELKTQLAELEEVAQRADFAREDCRNELATAQHELADAETLGKELTFRLAAKDKIISELKAQLSAALEHPPQ